MPAVPLILSRHPGMSAQTLTHSSYGCLTIFISFFSANHKQADNKAHCDCQPSAMDLLFCLLACYFCLVSVHLCLSLELSVHLSHFSSLSMFWSCCHSHAFMQQTQHDVSHICWVELNKEAFSASCLHFVLASNRSWHCIWTFDFHCNCSWETLLMKQNIMGPIQFNTQIASSPRSNCNILYYLFILFCIYSSFLIF